MTIDLPAEPERVSSRFAVWLLRPYLDLGISSKAPLHARGIEECWRSFSLPESTRFVPRRAMPPGFRAQLASEAGDLRYAVSDPRELPDAMRTARWGTIAKRSTNGASSRSSASAGFSYCSTRSASMLLPADAAAEEAAVRQGDVAKAELAFWIASSGFMLDLPKRTSDYVTADMSVFERLAREGPRSSVVRFDSAIMVFVHKAKTGKPLEELPEWAVVLEGAFQRRCRSSRVSRPDS